MDPEACIKMIEVLIEDNDTEEACQSIQDLVIWKSRGGFMTPNQIEQLKKFLPVLWEQK